MTDHHPYPGLTEGIDAVVLEAGSARLRFPTPAPAWIGAQAQGLREAGAVLQGRTATDLMGVLDAVNGRWADSASPERREADALLAAVTGYPAAVITPALDHLFAGLRA